MPLDKSAPPLAMKMKTKNPPISAGIYLFLADCAAHRTHLWVHCVWLGLINTYNVAGNRASRARVIIGEHFGLHYWTKSLPPRCVSICVRARRRVWKRGTGEEQETPAYCAALYAIMLNHMDRQVLCHNCKGTFDMAWYRGANKHKSPILLAQCQPVSQPLRQRASAGVCDVRIYLSYWEMQTLATQPWLNARLCARYPGYTVQCSELMLKLLHALLT